MPDDQDNPYRLPRTVLPSHYRLTLEPDLDAATFAGDESVTVTVAEPTDEVVLNAADIEVDSAGTAGWHIGDAPDQRSVDEANRRGVLLATTSPADLGIGVVIHADDVDVLS